MPRFVLLEHADSPRTPGRVHWDLMLEDRGALKTWELAAIPERGLEQAAVPLPDHRLAYLDYEGELSGSRGRVARVEAGEFQTLERSDDRWVARLAGRRLLGVLTLSVAPGGDHWRAELRDDASA